MELNPYRNRLKAVKHEDSPTTKCMATENIISPNIFLKNKCLLSW